MGWQMIEEKVMSKLSKPIANCIRNAVPMYKGNPEEIRLRLNRPVALTIAGENVLLDKYCTETDMEKSLQLICDFSMYSHIDTIREGYIATSDGIRVGICGRAVMENGRISVVRNITSLCIRIPHRYPGAADPLYKVLSDGGFRESILVFSSPGKGKTTVLRELAARLAEPPKPLRVAMIDTRFELGTELEKVNMLDILSGYPRNRGMEIAMRTLSPEYIICDEIASEEDRQALLECIGSGVRICASVHAGSIGELKQTKIWKTASSVFQWGYEIDQDHHGTLFRIEEEANGGC